MTVLESRVELDRDGFSLSVAVSAGEGEVVALLGPNGSGKSTVLSCLAGLLRPHEAEITLAGRTLTDARTHVPAHSRGTGLLAQQPLLFPHLSAVQNVAFGPRAKGVRRGAALDLAERWLAEVDAAGLGGRRPAQLSGGQAQRVALARALAGEPELLLLDEPFAALDVESAPALRALLRTVLRSGRHRAAVLVTHDPLDALVLADRVLVLSAGRVVEQGPTREVLTRPRTAFTARIAGLNLIRGTACERGVRSADGRVIAGLAAADVGEGEPAVAVFEPAAVAVHADSAVEQPPTGSPRNWLPATVESLEPYGPVVRLRATGPAGIDSISAELTPAALAELALEPGSRVLLVVKATQVGVHPAVR